MSSGIARRGIAVFGIAFTCACLGSYSRAVDETRAGLIGLAARDLRACLGVPTDFVIDGDVEHQTYRFAHEDEFDSSSPIGGIGGVVIGDRGPSDRAYDPGGFTRDEPDPSYCQLDFDLADGRVTDVWAQGRTREGMNADGSCMLRAEPCLSYADDEGAPDFE
jgi:hypothetical protein